MDAGVSVPLPLGSKPLSSIAWIGDACRPFLYRPAMTRRYALRDDQWDRIRDLLLGRAGHVGVTAKDNRLFVEAILYRYRAGIPWRDLPERFGDFRVIRRH